VRRLRIQHLTEYRFGEPTTLLEHRMLLRPREDHSVRIVSSTLSIDPVPTIRWQRDTLDNSVALVTFQGTASVLRIESVVVIDHFEVAPLDFIVETPAVNHPFQYAPKDALLLQAFVEPSWPADAPAIDGWLGELGLLGGTIETFT
jgi:transglutaminase-like putative cysteine protease